MSWIDGYTCVWVNDTCSKEDAEHRTTTSVSAQIRQQKCWKGIMCSTYCREECVPVGVRQQGIKLDPGSALSGSTEGVVIRQMLQMCSKSL